MEKLTKTPASKVKTVSTLIDLKNMALDIVGNDSPIAAQIISGLIDANAMETALDYIDGILDFVTDQEKTRVFFALRIIQIIIDSDIPIYEKLDGMEQYLLHLQLKTENN